MFLQHTPLALLTVLVRRFDTLITSIAVLIRHSILTRTLFTLRTVVVSRRDVVMALITELVVLVIGQVDGDEW